MDTVQPNSSLRKSTGVRPGQELLLAISWLWVGIPLAWGVVTTVMKSMALFK